MKAFMNTENGMGGSGAVRTCADLIFTVYLTVVFIFSCMLHWLPLERTLLVAAVFGAFYQLSDYVVSQWNQHGEKKSQLLRQIDIYKRVERTLERSLCAEQTTCAEKVHTAEKQLVRLREYRDALEKRLERMVPAVEVMLTVFMTGLLILLLAAGARNNTGYHMITDSTMILAFLIMMLNKVTNAYGQRQYADQEARFWQNIREIADIRYF